MADIADVGQISDGLWTIDQDPGVALRPSQMYYDRLVLMGALNAWHDYEITPR